jgi:hypothetical protein
MYLKQHYYGDYAVPRRDQRQYLSTRSCTQLRSSLLFSGSWTLIDEVFHPRLLTYDEWQTLYSLAAVKIHLYHPWARTGCRALLTASLSYRKSGIGSFIASAPAVKILSRSQRGLSS